MLLPSFATVILLGKIWALMYVLAILCIGLGGLVVARPSKRKIMKEED